MPLNVLLEDLDVDFYIERRVFMRCSIGGCVAYRTSSGVLIGSTKNRWETASLTFMPPLLIFMIFSRAEAKPSGYRVNSTEDASASNSLRLDMAA